jgi:hypothetical protein
VDKKIFKVLNLNFRLTIKVFFFNLPYLLDFLNLNKLFILNFDSLAKNLLITKKYKGNKNLLLKKKGEFHSKVRFKLTLFKKQKL